MMASKARLCGISLLLGLVMLPAYGAQPLVSSSLSTPFLQAVQTQAAVSGAIATLFQLPQVETASAAAQPPSTPVPEPTQTTVVIRDGQSLWDIATAYGVSVEAIVAANGLRNAELVHPGQRLVISNAKTAPAKQKTVAKTPSKALSVAKSSKTPATILVREGQTLTEIAEQYGTSVSAIVRANGLRSAHVIRAGNRLVIPGRQTASSSGRMAIASPLPLTRGQAVAARLSGFLWPARGVLTSRFGWRWRRHHDGIDIASPRGTPILAAKAGRVIFSGWYYGYGRTVIIDHGAGLTTVYGHASRLVVQNGEAVEAGQLIANVGCTGHCYGSHVHFEIRVNGKAVNPLKYL